jgi:hypothetical protein
MTTKSSSKESLELRQPVQAKKPCIVKMSAYSSGIAKHVHLTIEQ